MPAARQWRLSNGPGVRAALCLALLAAAFVQAGCAQGPQPEAALREPDVKFVPTTDDAVRAMLRLAGVDSSDIVYDLGCGDGRIVVEAARLFGAHGVGIDIDPQRIAEANRRAEQAGVTDLVRFEVGDLFQADFHEATVVTLFLLGRLNLQLRPRLLAELAPGTRVVSNTFSMGDWEPEREIIVPESSSDEWLSRRLFLWVVPGRE